MARLMNSDKGQDKGPEKGKEDIMFRNLVTTSAACAALMMTVSAGFAADLPPRRGPAVVPPAPAYVPPARAAVWPVWYLRADAGVAFIDDVGGASVDDAFVLGAGAGVKYNEWLRFDITADYQFDADISGGGDVDMFTALANVYLDIPTGTAFTPYVGIGAGLAEIDFSPGGSSTEFAWNATAGVEFKIAANTGLDVNYRYLDVGSAFGFDADSHQVRAGIRFYF